MISSLLSFEPRAQGLAPSRWASHDFPLLTGLANSVSRLGIHDCICLWQNSAVVYLDTEGTKRDLAFGVMQARDKAGAEPLGKIRVVVNHERELHSVIDILAREDNGFSIDLCVSSRLPALRPRAGEHAAPYLARIREAASAGSTFQQALEQHVRLRTELATELSTASGSSIKSQQTQMVWIRPNVEEMVWFRSLRFGTGMTPPYYRPRPARHSRAAYQDPFFLYYFDPYHLLLQWALVEALHEGAYSGPEPAVVNPAGEFLYGTKLARSAGSLWLGRKAVQPSSDGLSLLLSDSIPNLDDLELPDAVAREYRPDFVRDPEALADPRAWEIHADDEYATFSNGIGNDGQ